MPANSRWDLIRGLKGSFSTLHTSLPPFWEHSFLFCSASTQFRVMASPCEASRSYSDTPHRAGLLWPSDHPDAEASNWQHTTITKDRYPCAPRGSNPQCHQASGLRPRGHWDQQVHRFHTWNQTKTVLNNKARRGIMKHFNHDNQPSTRKLIRKPSSPRTFSVSQSVRIPICNSTEPE